jgi:hypothetical protein
MNASVVGQRDHESPKQGIKDAHDLVIQRRGVLAARLKLEGAVVAGNQSSQPIEHFAQGRMNVMVKGSFQVKGGKLAKMSLVPIWCSVIIFI